MPERQVSTHIVKSGETAVEKPAACDGQSSAKTGHDAMYTPHHSITSPQKFGWRE